MLPVELARSGKLGKLQTLHANTLDPKVTHDWLPAEPEPAKEVVDWDTWLGPCPWRRYHSDYVRGRWRGYFDFHGGGILEWGSHTVDLCQWANGVKLVMRDTGWLGLGTCSVRFEGDGGWIETGDTGKMTLSDNLSAEYRAITERGTDPVKEEFAGDAEANRMRSRAIREPWRI